MEKFPELDTSQAANGLRSTSPYISSPSGYSNGSASLSDRGGFGPKRENGHPAGLGIYNHNVNANGRGHGRQKSLSDAFRTIRTRNGSFSQNAHEIADALKAPVSPKLVVRRCPSLEAHTLFLHIC